MFIVSDGNISKDYDLELLEEICSFIDSKLRSYDENSYDEYADQLGEYDRLEHLTGLGFVACQTYMAATYSYLNVPKDVALKDGPKVSSSLSVAQLVNHAANLWKHCTEWTITGNTGPRRSLVSGFQEIGYSTDSEYPLSGCLAELTSGIAEFSYIINLLCEWRNNLFETHGV